MMKSFFASLFIVCAIGAAAYFSYEPYIKPLLSGRGIDLSGDAPREKAPSSSTSSGSNKALTEKSNTKKSFVKTNETASKAEPKSEIDQLLETKYPMMEILPLQEIVQNWKMVPPNAYPVEVVVNEMLAFDMIVDGRKIGSSKVAPGALLKPVRLLGDQLTVASLANPNMLKQVHVDKTDFKQRITKRYNNFVTVMTEQTLNKRAKAKKILKAKKGLLAMIKGVGGPADDSGDPRFSAVKASLRAGDCPTVKLEEAKSYKWNGSEEVFGPFAGKYDTVTVHFEVKTIFGEFPIDCKCLLKGGRVHAWIDPITQEKI